MFIQRKIVTLNNVTIFIMFEKTIFTVGFKKLYFSKKYS